MINTLPPATLLRASSRASGSVSTLNLAGTPSAQRRLLPRASPSSSSFSSKYSTTNTNTTSSPSRRPSSATKIPSTLHTSSKTSRRISPLPLPLSPFSSSSSPRSFSSSSSSSQSTPSELSPQEYHHLSESTLESLFLQLEDLVENSDHDDWEVEYSQGVLTLKVDPVGTYVLNKQPANKQIWLSSPTSGPKRFDYSVEEGAWVCLKEGQQTVFHELLDQELSEIMGKPIKVLTDVLRRDH